MTSQVLFLCTGNYYRSRFAESLFNHEAIRRRLDWRADSCGLALEFGAGNVGPMSSFSLERLQKLGIDPGTSLRFPKPVGDSDFATATLVIALDRTEHQPMMLERHPAWVNRIEYWDVADLGFTPAEDALGQIEKEVRGLIEKLSKQDTHILFHTERLLARQIKNDDLDAMAAVYGDADAMRWVGDGEQLSREGCIEWIAVTQRNYRNRGYGMSAIALRPSGKVIGFCGIVHPGGQAEPEIKYAFLREVWGQGFATETVQGMIAYGAEAFGMQKIIATVAPDNHASQRVLTKAGMQHAETQDNQDGTFTELFVWQASNNSSN